MPTETAVLVPREIGDALYDPDRFLQRADQIAGLANGRVAAPGNVADALVAVLLDEAFGRV